VSPLRQRSRVRPVGGTRRRTTWATHQSRESFAAANDLHTIDLLDQYKTAGGPVVGVTIARTLLRISQTTLPANGDVFDVGVIRGQSSDVGTNIAGAPSPSSDLYEDWAWLVRYTSSNSSGGPLWGEHGSNVAQLDIRSKRKLPELHMNWNLAFHSGTIATYDIYARTLLMLP